MGRAPCCDKANVKRGPWSPEEDVILREYMEKFGTGGNWIALPQKAGLKRCGKSCRLRWLNYLRPNIKHGEFSDEDDRVICSLYANIGSRWSIIAAQLPGRTDNDIKNYWNTKLKKKLMGMMMPTPMPHHQRNPLLPPPPPPSLSLYHNLITNNPTSLPSHYLPPLMNLNSTPDYYQSNPPKTLTTFESLTLPPYLIPNETNTSLANIDTASLLQNQDGLSFLVFGNDNQVMNGSSSGHSNNNGGREIKQEETLLFQDYLCSVLQENNYPKSNIAFGSINNGSDKLLTTGYSTLGSSTEDVSGALEDVKRLISGGLNIEEKKTQEKDVHYFW